jgi:hypothetical protein
VGIASGEAGAALCAADANGLTWVRLDDALAPSAPLRFPFAQAGGLFGVVAFGPRFAALAQGACPPDVRAARCLYVSTFAPEGSALGPIAAPLEAPIEHLHVDAADDLLVVARSSSQGPPVAELFTLEGEAIAHRSVRLETPAYPGALHPEVLAALAHDDRWAVAWRAGATEDPAGALLLSTPGGTHEVEALAEAAMIDALAVDPARPEGLLVLASFEWHRPRIFRLDPSGAMLGEPTEVPHGMRVGAPFGRPEVARLEREPGGLFLHRSTRGGDRVGRPVLIAPSSEVRRAALTVRGDDYLVAIAAREAPHALRIVRVACAPEP